MKTITNAYKNNIKSLGRELDSKITYTIDNTTYELFKDIINSITLHYEGNILKSVMKQLDIDCAVNIPIGTILTYQFGVLVNGSYEYITLGNFVVYSSEKQEDLNSYKIICYDKLLYSMIDYESFTTYPITIRDYIDELCTHINLTFANSNDTFPNYDKEIQSELYLDENNNTLNYTFRDVLDELAQVTASTICINDDDELELRYINDTEDTIDEEFLKDINVNFGQKFGAVNTISLKRSADADVVSKSIPSDLPDENKIEIAISDNQILNNNDRADYIDDILNQLYGLEYYTNDFSSTGVTYYDLCDMYSINIDNNTYKCIMFNDEILFTDGLMENIHTDMPNESKTDYNTSSKDDRTITRAELIVNKVSGQINALVQESNEIEGRVSRAEATLDSQGARLDIVSTNIDPVTGDVLALKRTNYEIGADGMITTGDDGYKSVRDTTGDYYYENDKMTGKYTKDGSVLKDMALFGKYYYGIDEDLDVENFTKDDAMFVAQLYVDNDGEEAFGHFWNGS